jgi:hypothetical protein
MALAQVNEQGRLIAAAAKAALTPLGCRRKGQSRLWYSDQRFWIISIEFQPSGWSKGSYLNVGAAWLWHSRTLFGFDAGYRIADFIPFENAEQFMPLVAHMAARAAQEILALREKFNSFATIHTYLITHVREGWPTYHAAVAAGLIGDITSARSLFQRFDAWSVSPNWQTKIESESAALATLLEEPLRYRSAVLSLVERRRSLMGLPADPNCFDILDSKAEP